MGKDFTPEEIKKGAPLFWKGKKVVVDPFVQLDFFLALDMVSPRELSVKGMVRLQGKERELGSFDACFPSCAIEHNFLRFFSSEVDPKWLEPKTVFDAEIPVFLKKLEKDPTIPEIVWKNKPKKEPLPVLLLTDRTGAFANLCMDYGVWGMEENPSSADELYWEKDLLETGFIKKIVDRSRYYCPPGQTRDQVGKSLAFLLEMGWTVLDAKKKRVVRQTGQELAAEDRGEQLLVKGSLRYGEYRADISGVMGAFNRKDRFVDLSPNTVGLIEMPASLEALSAETILPGGGIAVKRCRFGLLEDIVPLPEEFRPAAWEKAAPSQEFHGSLFPYQQKGVDWLSFLQRSGLHGLLADDMGLGKTVQVLAFLSTLSLEKPVLIVMPSSLLFNWKREFERFLPSWDVYLHSGPERTEDIEELSPERGRDFPTAKGRQAPCRSQMDSSANSALKGRDCARAAVQGKRVILTSYAILRQDRLLFEQLHCDCLILDEAQNIKNSDSLAAQIAFRLSSRFRLALTGTPVENRYEELWSLFRFLLPDLLGEKKAFFALDAVRRKIRPFLLRRLKQDVLADLPEKQEQEVFVEMSGQERALYDGFLQARKSGLLSKVAEDGSAKHRMEVLELVLRLRQIACHPRLVSGEYEGPCSKLERCLVDLDEAIANGHKVLLYSQFTSMLRLIEKEVQARGWGYAYLDGSTKDREEAVSKFQNDPAVPLFLVSLKAGGVGLNLTAADYVFLFDPWWNEAVENQAIDRAHRLGRKGAVIARRYICAESIEEKVQKLKGRKKELTEGLLDLEGDVGPITLDDLCALLG